MADSPDAALGWLVEAGRRRDELGLHRELWFRQPDDDVLDLASNDYLGLARDPRVTRAAADAALRWGASSTGSRLVTGTVGLHGELEQRLASFVGAPSALVYSSGYTANLAAVTALSGPDCLIVSDAGNHASLIDGCRLSRSRVAVVGHGDLAAAAALLAERSEPRALVIIESINSADGDLLPVVAWHQLARAHSALLVVDDAHGLGVRDSGRGSVAEAGLAGEPDVVTTVTLSKSLGSQGGAVLAHPVVREHLIDTSRSFIFDTGLAPAAAGAALAALDILQAEPELAKQVLANAAELAEISSVPATDSAVVPVIIGGAAEALAVATGLRALGVSVGCFRPPSVPVGKARLRVTARADLSAADLARYREALHAVGYGSSSGSRSGPAA